MERYKLAKERIVQIPEENIVKMPYQDFFIKEAEFLQKVISVMDENQEQDKTLEELQAQNYELYQDVLPQNYEKSYGNPVYAQKMLGEYGRAFTFLYTELHGTIGYAFEKKVWDITVGLELFLEMYSAFSEEELPAEKQVREILLSYVNDYCQDMVETRIREGVDPEEDFAVNIIMKSDLNDLRYLYRFGEYISESQLETARFLNSMSQEEIDSMAGTYTEGYRMGFVTGRKDIRKKKTVNIRYELGFERMVKAAILQFEEMGLKAVIYRHALHAVNKRSQNRVGFTGAVANPQFDYDHRQDSALFMDSDFVKRKLRAMQTSYDEYADLAEVHGGPAVIETFGEKPFSPVNKEECWTFSEAQQKLQVELDNESGQIVNRYIKGEERSFTIIAYPIPEIGENFQDIFREIVKINTLDYKKYQKIQQTIIDTLDTCEWVEIKGKGDNETDLLIHLHTLTDPQKQTNFENCVADVNIPLGEVFTSPVLAGTGGILHVSKVYLNGLQFCDLKLVFDCGQVIDYTCSNFDTEEENRKYIEDNILFHHPRLAMGEFAIGTNTTAYVAAQKYDIADKLPILIAEKMGPHFAVGDTCYSWAEDTPVYNPDGKEIIARDNEISEMRKDDVSLAYYGCHTDITIPYDELGSIRAVDDDGGMISVIEDGRFVLPGTEALNEAFGEL
ncbi:aminopeptidase [Blautia difficilis]|uniref:Aminopeptidase n=1 Tax=Blautia difficilis TaxID=2763027 RepID=A0ABR7IJ90_9FIRM|nr:aminopeptidase [Blautia difficilis]MBC5780054.1 aminopeptidase [Blautia difficilis]